MIIGELRENKEMGKEFVVDWSKFKSRTKGKMLEKVKRGYIEFCKMLDETDFELIGDYVGAREKIKLVYRLDKNLMVDTSMSDFKRTYISIINFKNSLMKNNDSFIKIIGLSKKGSLITKIKTFDGGIVDIDIRNYTQWSEGRRDFYNKLKEVDGSIEGFYIDTMTKINIFVNNVDLNPMKPIVFKRYTYKAVMEFKNKLKENKDKFIKFTGLSNGNLIAKIKTFDDGIININIGNYNSFNKGRRDFYNKLKEVNGYTTDYYADKSTYINIYINDIKLNPTSSNTFKRTYRSIVNFKNNIKRNDDEFIKFVGLTGDGNLIAQIKTFDGGVVEIGIASYISFTKARQDIYDYCKEKGYKVLSSYISSEEKILVDFNCGHKSHWILSNAIKKGIGCPICNTSKGEKAIREYLEDNNIEFKQEYKFENCKYKNQLPFDFYIPEYNLCIEFDGEQHYKAKDFFGGEEGLRSTKIRDKIKNKYCKENNINLLRIPYYELDEIESILDEEFDKLRKELKEVC